MQASKNWKNASKHSSCLKCTIHTHFLSIREFFFFFNKKIGGFVNFIFSHLEEIQISINILHFREDECNNKKLQGRSLYNKKEIYRK